MAEGDATIATLRRQLEAQPLWHDVADVEAVLEAAIAIQSIPAPTFAEGERARFVHDRMQELGLSDVAMDELANVYGRLPGRRPGPGVLITAHSDTVFGHDVDLAVRREGQRVYGPGLGDNSISIAAMLRLAQLFKQGGVVPERSLWFATNTGEEGLGDLRGMRAVVERLNGAVDGVIVIDSQYGSIVNGGVASRRFRIDVTAPGGHAWQDFGAPSAVHVLTRVAARITELEVPSKPRSSFNIGVITGGTTINAIAQHASLLLDLRSVDGEQLAAMVAQVEAIVGETRRAHPDIAVTVEVVGDRPGGSIDSEHPLVQRAIAAYRSLGADVSLEFASTDANVPLSRGIPAVCVGMCVGGNVHRVDEYVELGDVPNGMRALLLLVWATLQAAPMHSAA